MDSHGFTCQLIGSDIHCKDGHTQDEKQIALSDVLCVLPQSNKESNHDNKVPGYNVLFLQGHVEEAGAGSQKEYHRLESIRTTSSLPPVLSQRLYTGIPPHLDVSPQNTIHIISSVGSGTGIANSNFHNIIKPFFSFLGVTGYEVHETKSDQSIIDLARSRLLNLARAGVSQTIILLSGDGGLTDIVDVFYSNVDPGIALQNLPNIALIPSGTGNAMANSAGLLHHPISALIALLQGKTIPIPVFRATFSSGSQYITEEGSGNKPINEPGTVEHQNPRIYGAVVASWGIHAALVADSDTAEYRKFGSDRFKMAAKELLFPSSGDETHRYNGIITLTTTDPNTGEKRTTVMERKEHMYVLATFVSQLEKGFVISPDSKALDGRLRFIHFGPMAPIEGVNLMSLAYDNGKHVHNEAVTYTEIEGLRIEFREDFEKWRRVCIDGKIVGVPLDGWVDVQRETRNLLRLMT